MRNALGGLVLLTALTCAGLDTFSDEEEADTTIPGASLLEQLVGDIGFGGVANMDLSQSQALQNQGVSRNQIDSVRVTSLALTITSPASGADFTFLNSLSFFVEAPDVARQRIAHGGPFPTGASNMTLDLDGLDLAPYAAASSMSITTEVNGHSPSEATTIHATMDLEIDVNVTGALCGG